MSRARSAALYPTAMLLVSLLPTHRAWCARETILATFTASSHPRSDFEGAPFVDGAGNVFGTVSGVGREDTGAIYQITPHRHVTYLRKFMNTIERDPQSGVIGDNAGNLYGTTVTRTFMLAPDGTFVETALGLIGGSGCGGTGGGLVLEANGNVAGVVTQGRRNECSRSIYTVSPSQTVTMLYTFAGDLAGAQPAYGSLAIDASGNLYGATQSGGTYNSGTIYRVTPAGLATVLYSFSLLGTHTTCVEPNAGLVLDAEGNIYGTTNDGGNSGHGCVFKLSSSGQLTILHNFAKSPTFPIGADGEYPNGGVAIDPSGNVYGTTRLGGTSGYGVVFKVRPGGGEKIVHSFAGHGDVGYSVYGVTLDASGNIYGNGSSLTGLHYIVYRITQ